MSPLEREAGRCPHGYDEERIAALVVAWEDTNAQQHLFSCAACASLYVDHLLVSDEAAQIAGARGSRPPGARRRLLRPLVAAAGVLLASAIAIGGYRLLRPTGAYSGFSAALGLVSEIEASSGIQFEAAGFSPTARVIEAQPFLLDDHALGSALVVDLDPFGRMDVAGFDVRRRGLWRASTGWDDWSSTLGAGALDMHCFGSIVTRRSGEKMEETLVLSAGRDDVTGVFCIDPLTGRLLGSVYHLGVVGRMQAKGDAITVLPAPDGEVRTLLTYGGHGAPGTDVTPCVILFRIDGTVLQHVELPTVGLGGSQGVEVVGCEVDWTPGEELVRLTTDEDITFDLPVIEGRLQPAGARVVVHDSAADRIAKARGDPRGFEKWLDPDGDGSNGRLRMLVEGIRETEMEEVRPWTVR